MKDRNSVRAQTSAALPTIVIDGETYFVDLSLRVFRRAFSPGKYIDFDSIEGERLCRSGGVVSCRQCGMSAIASQAALRKEALRCMRCQRRLDG